MLQPSLAERFRPKSWDEFVGQNTILNKNQLLHRSIARKSPANILFWGPPGTGKTTAARLYIKAFDKPCYDMHPSSFSAQKIKDILESAQKTPLFRPTLLWIDEVHRLTSPQQDLLLKAIEDQDIVVLAATTENPSFCLRPALLSRMHAFHFLALTEEDLQKLLDKLSKQLPSLLLDDEAKGFLCQKASGDARKLFSFLEILMLHGTEEQLLTHEEVRKLLTMDTSGTIASHKEGRYLLISALHKAVRGSDCHAALYWFARLLEAQEDPLYIARRLIRMAIEDIGLADPQALSLATQAFSAYSTMGSPEGDLALAEVVLYLALSPKSASAYLAYNKARELACQTRHILPPAHILNAPTKWMKKEGFSEGYIWEHDLEDAVSHQSFWPKEISPQSLYTPVLRGFERTLIERLSYFERIRTQKKKQYEAQDSSTS